MGSPPRLRGAEKVAVASYQEQRITPAPAGSRWGPLVSLLVPRDHPRACGEQGLTFIFAGVITGSPPRLRGAGLIKSNAQYGSRITPAPAGSSYTAVRVVHSRRDHPRACGEQPSQNRPNNRGVGSPPRLRGAVAGKYMSAMTMRITPAPAGSRQDGPFLPSRKQDHPRACGEQMQPLSPLFF